ncbi:MULTISPECIES: VapE domain-containing protein [unclassified Caballeronia]|uniref:VapE domain-containing protein n=1 Tax=unclassified Caballeronia TaxID=2646786 RepID=UPI002861BEFD|nr:MULTISPECIES: VapE domain-containing protein [unclassified Caballeronia]MDR5772094.1 VapE family protein [Caballeronia sp. LZ002]MDR5847528.1 VapE family protein [Caballeronia sp. LZ003]
MNKQILVDALAPIVSRVVTSHCWVKRDGDLSHIRQALTPAKLAHHVNGGPAYGAAQIEPGASVTRIALLDLDSHKGETPWSEMQAVTQRVLDALAETGLRGIPFRSSGGNGIHIYMLWDAPQDAYSVRVAPREAIETCGFTDGVKGVSAGQIECFPKQNSVPADKWGNMFVLPLAGKSVPLDTFELEDMPKEYAADIDWTISDPVPMIEREAAAAPVVGEMPVELAQLREALAAIPNSGDDELDYDEWRNVMFALHHATDGSDDGLALAHEFSARSSKYDPTFLDERVWPHIKHGHDGERGAITGRTILHMAREHGWQESLEDDFEIVPLAPGEKPSPKRPSYRRNGQGDILAVIENVVIGLENPNEVGVDIRFDEFRAEIMLAQAGSGEWRTLTDADYTRLQIRLEQIGFKKLSKEMMRDAVWLVADDHRFDSAVEWIETLEHDGVARIETFLHQYMSVPDTPYTRAVSRYMWTALAGRVLAPGCEAPMVPVFIGGQGAGKTRSVKAISPAVDFYTELNLADRDADASRVMRGRLVLELGELRGLHTRDSESIKAFISRTHENWVPKFKEFSTQFARRFLFFGTTNQEEFLADETGERRWLPIRVGRCDVAAIARDCLQLWAEARDVFELAGIDWQDAEKLAADVHAEHKISDPWAPIVQTWLETPEEFDGEDDTPGKREFLQVHEVLVGALRMDAKQIGKREEQRIGRVLQALGFVRGLRRVNGKPTRVWEKPD